MKRLMFAMAIVAASASYARVITEKDLFSFRWIADPQLSPDGSQIAFVRVTVDEKKDRYDTSIWSVPARGGDPRELTAGPSDSAPRWSPDGQSLAFLRSVEKDAKPQPAQIYILPLNGGEARAVTSLSRAIDSIAWSPSGRTIAFTARTKPEDVEEKKKSEEHVSDVRVINQAVYRSNGPGYLDPTRAVHIWTLDVPQGSVEAAKPKQLTSGDFSEDDPVWSPDGSRIYFTSNRVYEAYYDRRDTNLYAIPASGGEMTKVADIEGPISDVAPSPDGKWIAFRGTLNNPVHSYDQPDLFVVDVGPALSRPGQAESLSHVRNLTATYDYDLLSGLTGDQAPPRGSRGSRPAWSSDSKTIYVTSAEEGKVNLKRVDAANGRMEGWTSGKQDILNFIARDGDFAVQIGLAVKGESVAGVVYQPVRDVLYRAVRGGGAWIEDEDKPAMRMSVSSQTNLSEMVLASSRSHRSPRMERVVSEFGFKNELRRGSVGVKIGLIAEQKADLYLHLSPSTKQWDTCGPEIILVEAGGRLTDLFGQPLRYNGIRIDNRNGIVATNGAAHEIVIKNLAPLLREFGRVPV